MTDATPPPADGPPPTPRPTRIPTSRDPTQPIQLRRTATPPPRPAHVAPDIDPAAGDAAATGSASAAGGASADEAADRSLNADATLVGKPVPPRTGPRIVVIEDLGRDATLVAQASEELGREATLIGMPAPRPAAPASPLTEELGREATLIGAPTPPPGTAAAAKDEKKTSPTIDDGWHFKGRKGPLTGQTVGDYEIGGILGEGGMGTVYRARQISLKRRVAFKVLPPNLAADLRLRERFEQEARTASLLNSPFVVQVFAAGRVEDMVYFVMEFVEGTDLSDLTREREGRGERFTPDESATFVLQAARGLAEAGRHQIVHRDIKPANLMVTKAGQIKIADFGISKIAGEHQLTMTGTAVGTPAYCSPEQGRGDPVDGRADLYSLGVVFYELLTGRKPFDGATANALIYQHNYAEPPLPRDIRADIPEAYQAVVLRCLQKDPAARYQSADELVADLERVRAGSAPMTALMNAFGTGAEEAMRRLGIKQRRLWPYVVAAAVLVIGASIAIVAATTHSNRAQAQLAEIARLRTQLTVLDKALPIPRGADATLASLQGLVGGDDKDCLRWKAKLARVGTLQAVLQRLDPHQLPNHTLQETVATALRSYEEEVGSTGEDVRHVHQVLDAAAAAAARDRAALGELDRVPVVTLALAERLAPPEAELTGLIGAEDPDVRRWQQRLVAAHGRVATLRAALAVLDDPHEVLTEALLNRAAGDCDSLGAIVGAQDAGVRAATARIAAGRDRLARLRESLARLDAVDLATTALQATLKPDLTAYATLVDASDPQLVTWQRKISDSQARIAHLRTRLARLDRPEPVSVADQAELTDLLAAYRAMVGPDDGQYQAWSERLRSEAAHLQAMRESLARLDHGGLPLAELTTIAANIDLLTRLGGISEDARVRATRSLQDQLGRVTQWRAVIRAHPAGGPVEVALADAVVQLRTVAGATDPDVAPWSARCDRFVRERTWLLPLDQIVSPPPAAAEHLAAYAEVAGADCAEVRRWQAKLTLIARLRHDLAPLDQPLPLPATAPALLHDLIAQVGGQDADVQRWTGKLHRVDALRTQLTQLLTDAYVLPPDAPAAVNELLALVGSTDPHAHALAARLAVLIGPPRPAWASDWGRDEYGLWADLTVAGVTQRLRYIPSGIFLMGSPEHEAGRDPDETQVRVTLTHSFWLADSECTQAFWHAITGTDPSRFAGLDRPVERVSWDDCTEACIRLSRMVPTLRAALPTEAEWEYACRAGVSGPVPGADGPIDPAHRDRVAWYRANAAATHGVKARACNRLGLCDMLGNVWEWCQDRYGSYSSTPVTDPVGHEQELRVIRGGSWGDSERTIRAANRAGVRQNLRTLYVGMRLRVAVDWPRGHEPPPGSWSIVPDRLASIVPLAFAPTP